MAGTVGREIYGTQRWKRARLLVLTAARWRCCRCGRYANEVHHVQSLADGGDPFNIANLEARCRDCHLTAHLDPVQRAWRALTVATMMQT